MTALPEPTLTHRAEGGRDEPLLVWQLPEPVLAISSAVLGGGIGRCEWVVNATVPMSYDRDDPADHLRGMAEGLGLRGPGIGLLTGVDVAEVIATTDGGVQLWATVGLGVPVRAAAPPVELAPRVGTVNFVAWVPARLSAGALVNAVATITEAKAQAIRDLGWDATGTPTDAVCVLCPAEPRHESSAELGSDSAAGPRTENPAGSRNESPTEVRNESPAEWPVAAYAGPRSFWGAKLARAAYEAVRTRGVSGR
ncbi:adenosylcobinamide amidohydrolase [Actinoplanes sp. TRM 88003]|uniref:Adenosylcobinamide amidohydrolase n=1 Tax=Paractinoplanes aksuensis TaxID=2939490 RepID=A0ABT1DJF6_9ACTN|nr:adenosylcobinamide amidohydrolase [Actinoplanes aksuensis]MCO8270613.1 adenosylcobinamide amidohydrolase [Actinoplanes aksuensis]